MTNDKAKKMFSKLRFAMEYDHDPYMFVHFSREQNHILGLDSLELDSLDALVIIRHLINKFDLDPLAIANMTRDKVISN